MSESFTVGELRRELDGLPDDHVIEFEGGLSFSRLKRCDDNAWVVCFQQNILPLSEKTSKIVQVAFAPAVQPDGIAQTGWLPEI